MRKASQVLKGFGSYSEVSELSCDIMELKGNLSVQEIDTGRQRGEGQQWRDSDNSPREKSFCGLR